MSKAKTRRKPTYAKKIKPKARKSDDGRAGPDPQRTSVKRS